MGERKKIGPVTQAQDRLHSMKPRKKRLNQRNGMEDADMEVHETPTAPSEPTNPQQPSKQLSLETAKQAQLAPCPPQNQNLFVQPEQDTPPAIPTHDSPKPTGAW